MRLYLENIANVTISLVIGTTESFVLGPTMEDAFVANASAWQNTTSPATLPVNAWPQMKPALPLMVNILENFVLVMVNVHVENANVSKLRKDSILDGTVKIAQPALENVKNCKHAFNANNFNLVL